MAVQVYGITPEVLHERFFPTAQRFTTLSKPTRQAVADIIASVASLLNVIVRGLGRDPMSITEADYPQAYAFLADTLSLGAHRRIGSAGIQGGITRAMESDDEEYLRRMAGLQQTPGIWLPELSGQAGAIDVSFGPAREPRFTMDTEA